MPKSDCQACDGWGIALLFDGRGPIKCPCLLCSPQCNLEALEREKYRHYESQLIEDHNERMRACPKL